MSFLVCTAPYPPASCKEEGDADYNCSCRQYFKYTNHCEVLVTIDVGGYPTPRITWIVSDTVATNDNQAVLNILDNGSVSNIWTTALASQLATWSGNLSVHV